LQANEKVKNPFIAEEKEFCKNTREGYIDNEYPSLGYIE